MSAATHPGQTFFGAKRYDIQRGLAIVGADNARRVPCQYCNLRILPETMSRHVALCHDD